MPRTVLNGAVALLIIATVTACGGGQSAEDGTSSAFLAGDENRLYNEGVAAQRAGDLSTAEARYRDALRANDRFLAAHLQLGELLLEQRRFSEAEESFNAARELRSSSLEAALGLALVRLESGHVDEALSSANEALAIAVEQENTRMESRALTVVGAAQASADSFDDAKASFERALRVDSTNVDARIGLARILVSHGESTEAIRLLRRAELSGEDNLELKIELGKIYHELKVFDRAIETLDGARGMAPNNVSALYYLSASHLGAGNWDFAVQFAGEALALDPTYADAYAVRGRAEFRRGYPSRARDDVQRALQLDATNAHALLLLGDIEESEGDLEAAEAAYLSALDSAEGEAEAVESLLRLYRQQSRWEEIVGLLEPRIDQPSRGEDWLSMLAHALGQSGRHAEAVAYQSRLALTRPQDYEIHVRVVRAALDHPGSLTAQQILEHARLAFEAGGPQRLEARLALIDALIHAGQLDEARAQIESGLDDLPNNPELVDRREELRRR